MHKFPPSPAVILSVEFYYIFDSCVFLGIRNVLTHWGKLGKIFRCTSFPHIPRVSLSLTVYYIHDTSIFARSKIHVFTRWNKLKPKFVKFFICTSFPQLRLVSLKCPIGSCINLNSPGPLVFLSDSFKPLKMRLQDWGQIHIGSFPCPSPPSVRMSHKVFTSIITLLGLKFTLLDHLSTCRGTSLDCYWGEWGFLRCYLVPRNTIESFKIISYCWFVSS